MGVGKGRTKEYLPGRRKELGMGQPLGRIGMYLRKGLNHFCFFLRISYASSLLRNAHIFCKDL